MKLVSFIVLILFALSCNDVTTTRIQTDEQTAQVRDLSGVTLVVLGTLQDAGSPHIACKKDCCAGLFDNPDPNRKVVSLGLIDHANNKSYLFEATPDISSQLKMLQSLSNSTSQLADGIFLTHAHIGHYTGLMYLGKEATNASEVPVYAMPRMLEFLEKNGPWGQLVSEKNILLKALAEGKEERLTDKIKVTPFLVPHRDEYSETVGYRIMGPNKSVVFIPDIDKWERWKTDIKLIISENDHVFIDATFYDKEEINNRDISEIPHPFIIESMELLKDLSVSEKNKVQFIHFNHTNPVIDPDSTVSRQVKEVGFNIARINTIFKL